MHVLKRLAAIGAMVISTLSCAEPGVTDSTITIGMSSPFSGPNGAYGVDMRQTIEAYFAQVNKGGGINGRKLSLVALDDGYETERTVANTKSLINEKNAFALLAFYGSSPTTEAMNTVFGPAKVPLIGTISGAGTLREAMGSNPNARYMFNVRASYADETEAIVNQLAALGLKNIAVFYQNDGFGKSGLEGVTAALKKHNLAPSAVGTVERHRTIEHHQHRAHRRHHLDHTGQREIAHALGHGQHGVEVVVLGQHGARSVGQQPHGRSRCRHCVTRRTTRPRLRRLRAHAGPPTPAPPHQGYRCARRSTRPAR